MNTSAIQIEGSAVCERLRGAGLPRHVGIIMDGNGRWARKRLRPRVFGHRAGVQAVRDTVTGAAELGLEYLTLYAFSTENWMRPAAEVSALMALLREYLSREAEELRENNIQLRTIGRVSDLNAAVRREVDRVKDYTTDCDGMVLSLALSYSGRTELVDSFRALARQVRAGSLEPDDIDERAISQHLYTCDYPDPDLLIRSSGEVRVSNFLLWQIAYCELWVTPTLWPDFRREHLYQAIGQFQRRERRFGCVP